MRHFLFNKDTENILGWNNWCEDLCPFSDFPWIEFVFSSLTLNFFPQNIKMCQNNFDLEYW